MLFVYVPYPLYPAGALHLPMTPLRVASHSGQSMDGWFLNGSVRRKTRHVFLLDNKLLRKFSQKGTRSSCWTIVSQDGKVGSAIDACPPEEYGHWNHRGSAKRRNWAKLASFFRSLTCLWWSCEARSSVPVIGNPDYGTISSHPIRRPIGER